MVLSVNTVVMVHACAGNDCGVRKARCNIVTNLKSGRLTYAAFK